MNTQIIAIDSSSSAVVFDDQFAREHGIKVGDSYEVAVLPSGGLILTPVAANTFATA